MREMTGSNAKEISKSDKGGAPHEQFDRADIRYQAMERQNSFTDHLIMRQDEESSSYLCVAFP